MVEHNIRKDWGNDKLYVFVVLDCRDDEVTMNINI